MEGSAAYPVISGRKDVSESVTMEADGAPTGNQVWVDVHESSGVEMFINK